MYLNIPIQEYKALTSPGVLLALGSYRHFWIIFLIGLSFKKYPSHPYKLRKFLKGRSKGVSYVHRNSIVVSARRPGDQRERRIYLSKKTGSKFAVTDTAHTQTKRQ